MEPGGPDAGGRVTTAFWEDDYLGRVELPSRPDPSMPFERSLAAELERSAAVAPGARVIEIGCAPAKWLAFYAERFEARVEGIEYTRHGVELSRANLAALGIPGTIRHEDFFTAAPGRFDLVLSLGFIEHFEDLRATFARHVDFLAPGGRLVIGVPNFRGLLGVLQHLTDDAHLRLHNRAAMEPALYRSLAREHGLEVASVRYVGGLDPAMVKLGRRALLPPLAVLELLRRPRLADRLNGRLLSSYLLAVLKRPPGSSPV